MPPFWCLSLVVGWCSSWEIFMLWTGLVVVLKQQSNWIQCPLVWRAVHYMAGRMCRDCYWPHLGLDAPVCALLAPPAPPALHILHRPDLPLLLCQHWQAYQPPFWQEQLLRRGSHDEWESPCSQCCWRWVTSSRPFGQGRSASNADNIWFGLGIRS